jgi:GTP-binding protein
VSSRTPIVAIVGRPNVGKSTLFNRYAGRRQALVENSPGVTRDRIFAEIEVSERPVLLVDTAGLDRQAGRGLPRAVQAQAWIAIEEADAILFVVDGQSGLLGEDESLAKTLHKTSKPVTLVVNKIDVPKHESRTAEFHALGFVNVAGVSAEHGRGAWDALEALVAELPVDDEGVDEETDGGIRVALVGRPNVGKSSLVNRLAGIERVVVSDVPGTTRDAIDTRIEHQGEVLTLVDTAGLRRPGRRSEFTERVSALMAERSLDRAHVALIAIDASEGFTDQDAKVANTARERGCATGILANKWDLVAAAESGRAQEVRDQISHGLRFMSDAPVLGVSALTGSGVDRILGQVSALAAVGRTRIPTADLNRWLEQSVARHEPAMAQRGVRRHALKLFYATQTSVRPPTFVIFCNQPDALKVEYRRFLENRLRERFDLAGTPVRIRLRARQH